MCVCVCVCVCVLRWTCCLGWWRRSLTQVEVSVTSTATRTWQVSHTGSSEHGLGLWSSDVSLQIKFILLFMSQALNYPWGHSPVDWPIRSCRVSRLLLWLPWWMFTSWWPQWTHWFLSCMTSAWWRPIRSRGGGPGRLDTCTIIIIVNAIIIIVVVVVVVVDKDFNVLILHFTSCLSSGTSCCSSWEQTLPMRLWGRWRRWLVKCCRQLCRPLRGNKLSTG